MPWHHVFDQVEERVVWTPHTCRARLEADPVRKCAASSCEEWMSPSWRPRWAKTDRGCAPTLPSELAQALPSACGAPLPATSPGNAYLFTSSHLLPKRILSVGPHRTKPCSSPVNRPASNECKPYTDIPLAHVLHSFVENIIILPNKYEWE